MQKIYNVIRKAARAIKLLPDWIIYFTYRRQYSIDKSFRFNGGGVSMYGGGDIVIAANTYLGQHSILQVAEGTKITIGKNCRISHFVKMYTTSNDVNQDFNFETTSYSKDIVIGDGVWIGAGVFINPGITIGDNAVIGANSVVTKDVEKYSVVGGVPARLIKYKDIK